MQKTQSATEGHSIPYNDRSQERNFSLCGLWTRGRKEHLLYPLLFQKSMHLEKQNL